MNFQENLFEWTYLLDFWHLVKLMWHVITII